MVPWPWSQSVPDEASSVLLDEPDFHLTVNEEKELGRSGMGVGGVHSARSGEWFTSCVRKGIEERRCTRETYSI
jgi:hypothetical protein